jgi:hypothetical protein
MFASKNKIEFALAGNLFTSMSDDIKFNISVGDLVCFEGDEKQLSLGVGLVMEIRGDFADIEQINETWRSYEDGEIDYFRMAELTTDVPMILVMWSRPENTELSEISLYKNEKKSYSIIWVYPTEVRVVRSKDGRE